MAMLLDAHMIIAYKPKACVIEFKGSSYQRYVDLKRISCDAEVKVHWKSIIVKNCLEIV